MSWRQQGSRAGGRALWELFAELNELTARNPVLDPEAVPSGVHRTDEFRTYAAALEASAAALRSALAAAEQVLLGGGRTRRGCTLQELLDEMEQRLKGAPSAG